MSNRLYCSRTSKPHLLGTVEGDEPLVLSYRQSVMTVESDAEAVLSPQDGLYYRRSGAEAHIAEPVDAALLVDVWCKSCRTGHPVDVRALFDAARAGRSVSLNSRGVWEGFWQ